MRTRFLIIKSIAVFLLSTCFLRAQVTDYRDPFIGLYHAPIGSPCINGNEQTPPNHYIFIEKDTGNPTGIYATDTTWFDASPPNSYGFRHPATLTQSDSSYIDGGVIGKFVLTDSLKINTAMYCSGAIYYLRKIAPIGIYTIVNKDKEWYLFPNPAVNELNIVFPGLTEVMNLQVLDINGKLVLEQKFKTSTQIDVGDLPKGVYVVRVRGKDVNLSKRVVLVN